MATIYVIRHGQASFGAANYDILSKLGRRQAEVMGHYFRDCGVQFDAVYSGDLQRQQDTARLAIAGQSAMPEHHIDARFNEIRNDEQLEHLMPIVLEKDDALRELVESRGLRESKDYQKAIRAVFNHWVSPECNHPEIQSWSSYSSGVREALARVMAEQGRRKTVGIFTSGGTIATIVAQVLGLGGDRTYQFYEPMLNCSVTRIFYSGSKVSLSYFNDCSFLQVLGQQLGENLVTYR
ncbi:MAG: phosphoglycerate mutase family protein [Halieaceae bacterium]|nr:phosphoglycerate mutase family protein [Halieaceae bacterium]